MKKIISVLILASMLLMMFVSCTEAPEENEDTDAKGNDAVSDTAVETEAVTEAEVLEIPDEKFPDIDFTILVNENYSWNYAYADFDEPSDDALANALYERNLAVEEMLGCKISQMVSSTYDSIATDFSTVVDAGDDTAFE